ncbi:MAG: hypothetical protein NVSMB30_29900 [Hymenobacter sp.]
MFSPSHVLCGLLCGITYLPLAAQPVPIDRRAVVERHRVVNTTTDTLAALSVGNGMFAFTADVTGLQTFPAYYEKGVPLGTESEWGWHSFPNVHRFSFDATVQAYEFNGQSRGYSVQRKEPAHQPAVDYFRENPHRLQLGNLGFVLLKANGLPATIHDLRGIRQELNPWTGELKSQFSLEGTLVQVVTVGHQTQDAVAVRVESDLLKAGRLKVALRLPYPTAAWADMGTFYGKNDRHRSAIRQAHHHSAVVVHQLDTTKYVAALAWQPAGTLAPGRPHEFVLTPGPQLRVLEFTCRFSPRAGKRALPTFAETRANSQQQWAAFWRSGGAVDFGGTADPRARELERRIVLSQYLTKMHNAGAQPPQETGLLLNSWYGRPHLEMHWWHAAHFAL